jgi:hypothetical protein
MLNELYKLAETLAENNIQQYSWHIKYKPLPGGDCYRVWLDGNGRVTDVALMDKPLVAVCRKYGNNQQTFPAFNVAPLYRVTSDQGKTYYDALIKGKEPLDIERLRKTCVNDNWGDKLLGKIGGCLRKEIPNMPGGSAIFALMRITGTADVAVLRVTLEARVWARLSSDVKTYLPLLIFKGNKKKEPKDDTGSLSIMLDIASWEQYGDPITNETSTKQINEWLRASTVKTVTAQSSESGKYDAFGAAYSDVDESMPSVRLAPGFEVALRAMFREQVCQYRYSKADDRSFPITQANRDKEKTSLEWIAQADNENKTWRKIDNGAMMFVYPGKLPKIIPRFAELFGGGNEKTEKISEARFENIAKRFIATVNGLPTDQKPENIHMFALQQIPPALSKRAKVVFTRNLTVDGLINAAQEWQSGCANLPDISPFNPITPFPLDVSETANKVWKQDGTRADGKKSVKLIRYYQGIELLLDAPYEFQLLRILHGLIVHTIGLVQFVGNNLSFGKGAVKDTLRKEVGLLFPLFGLLLYKSGIFKEDYMENSAYLLGQLLKISDGLHELYCEVKRGGDVPPQLAGSSVFVTAAETPLRALALLGTRMQPYISWACQYRTQNQEKSGLANWYLQLHKENATQMKSVLTEDERFNDYKKAQLFIGYLAAFPKKEEQTTNEEEITNERN